MSANNGISTLESLIRRKWPGYEAISENFIRYKLDLEKFQDANLRRVVFAAGRDLNGLAILDIGCGEGGFTVAANLQGAVAYGVDYQPRFPAIAYLVNFGDFALQCVE